MLLASGFNAILYQATPCLLDLTDLSFAMNTLDFSAADEPNELRSSVERFENECGATARRLAIAMLRGEHGPDMRTYLEDQLAAHAETLEQKQKQLAYPASKFYQEVFYKPCAGGAARFVERLPRGRVRHHRGGRHDAGASVGAHRARKHRLVWRCD